MTNKERFIGSLTFKGIDRVPFMEIAAWPQTLERWRREGLPDYAAGGSFMTGHDYFGFEGYDFAEIQAASPEPPFVTNVIYEDERYEKFTDSFGRTRLGLKEGSVGEARMSMDSYIDFPVKSREDFVEMRRRYEGDVVDRYPDDWNEVRGRLIYSTRPVSLLNPLSGTFGFYSMLRNWFGTEKLSYLWYDDPVLAGECLEFLGDYAIRVFEKAVSEIELDFYYIHEDMAGKSGPLMSPELFRRFISPQYIRLIDFLRGNGIRIILVDTDGNFEPLIPAFLDAGVDGFGPIERASNMDPVRLRQTFGESFCMIGGIDKRALSKGKREIDDEIQGVVVPMLEKGGFIPTVDHSVPPDVSLVNFRYYLEQKWKAIAGR
jgi:hypothetical protein